MASLATVAAAQSTLVAGGPDLHMTIKAGDLSVFEPADFSFFADALLVVALVAGYCYVHTRRSQIAISTSVLKKTALIECDAPFTRSRQSPPRAEQSPTDRSPANADRAPANADRAPARRPRSPPGTDICRKLNQSICACDTTEGVLSLVASSGHQMNAVNLSTAMHRVARWTKKSHLDVDEVRSSAPWKKLVRLAHLRVTDMTVQGISNMLWAVGVMRLDVEEETQFLNSLADAARNHASEHTPQALANIAWACAVLQWRNEDLLTSVRDSAITIINGFNPQDLSNIAWALGTISFLDTKFLDAMAPVAIPMLGACKPAELSNILWAFATAGCFNQELMERASDVVCEAPEALTSQAVSNVAWSCATLGHNDERLMGHIMRVAIAKMRWFSPSELANLLWACATLNTSNHRLLDGACVSMVRSSERYTGEDLSNSVWALATLQHCSTNCCETLVRAAMRQDKMAPKAMTNILWGFATLGYKGASSLFVSWAPEFVRRSEEFTTTELVTIAWSYAAGGVRTPELLECIQRATRGSMSQDEEQALKLAFQKLSF